METLDLVLMIFMVLAISTSTLAFCRRYRIPFTISLVLVGIVISHIGGFLAEDFHQYLKLSLSPNIIFYVCLPILIFESAYHLQSTYLRRNIFAVLSLAIPGLLISTFVIGFIISYFTNIDFLYCILLGSILSATDPIAVVSLFKKLGAPKRLTVLVEGESLFNDASAIVISKLIFTIILAGSFSSQHILDGGYDFVREFFGGILFGYIISVFVGYLLKKVNSNAEIEISLSILLAYGSFLIAQEFLHVSGVMATVTAGLLLRSWGRTRVSSSIKTFLEHFWSFLAYMANCLIFLLVGFGVKLNLIIDEMGVLLVVIVAMLISRAIVAYLFLPLIDKFTKEELVPIKYRSIIFWGGLRGAVALAIVMSLPNHQYSELFQVLVTGGVLFTLIVQGLTIEPLMHLLKLNIPPLYDRIATEEGNIASSRQAQEKIPNLLGKGLFSPQIACKLKEQCEERVEESLQRIEKLRSEELDYKTEKCMLMIEAMTVERHSYQKMFNHGHLSEHNFLILSSVCEEEIELLRYQQLMPELKRSFPLRYTYRLAHIIQKYLPLSNIFEALETKRVINNYERYWAQNHAYETVGNFLLENSRSMNQSIFDEITQFTEKRQQYTTNRLNLITENFPHFVANMQERLADRMLLVSEIQTINEMKVNGALPESAAETLLCKIEEDLRRVREKANKTILLDPKELLKNIPFIQAMDDKHINEILPLLKQHIHPNDDVIFAEGAKGSSLYIVARGTLELSQKSKGITIAKVMSGDIFGELSLLEDEKRLFTAKTLSPCVLYELSKKDFFHLVAVYPEIQIIVEKSAKHMDDLTKSFDSP
jgi:CPA1 family monovalent cation:H+ antiporter